MNNLLSIYNLESSSIEKLIEGAIKSKQDKSDKNYNFAKDKILALIFEKPSTRTRLSFDVAMRKLGGQSIVIDQNKIHLGNNKESVSDTAQTMSQYVDLIMYRSQSHKTLEELVKFSSIPIINGLSDFSHPCQALADLMTVCEQKSKMKGIKVNWIGPITNVTRSWIELANLEFGIELSIFSTDYFIGKYNKKCETYNVDPDLNKVNIFNNLKELENADVVITDTWESMGENINEKIKDDLKSYSVDKNIMKRLGDNCIFMHCLPAKRGQEVSGEVIDGPQSVVWEEAKNRMHIQKEILKWCL